MLLQTLQYIVRYQSYFRDVEFKCNMYTARFHTSESAHVQFFSMISIVMKKCNCKKKKWNEKSDYQTCTWASEEPKTM